MKQKWTFIQVAKALWDWRSWKYEGTPFFPDCVYGNGVYFYLDHSCVRLHYIEDATHAYEASV